MVIPSDPVFGFQWHLRDVLGVDADLNVTEVWDDYQGNGVVVGILDDGIDYLHQDLATAYRQDLDYDIVDNDNDAFASAASDAHGTAVAGMIAGAINGAGSVGVAPGADISGIRLNTAQTFDDLVPHAQAALEFMDTFDVANFSWRITSIYFRDNFLSGQLTGISTALRDAASTGRGGLGTVVTTAAGNEGETGDNVNYHNLKNSQFGITVGSIDRDGNMAADSTPGAAVLVSAPGASVVTTDGRGNSGYVAGDYVQLSGTSFAAPAVAGVAALMLEANSALGYRDVQEILAYSARNPLASSAGWQNNGAENWNGGGLQYRHDYGFGLVDAHAAVRLAETWNDQSTYANRQTASETSIDFRPITDNGTITDDLSISGTGIEIQHIEVGLSITHPFIGDLSVEITSPSGTTSTLVNRPGLSASSPFGSGADNINFTLSSVHFLGESFDGTWTLTVSDNDATFVGTLNAWSLTAYGDTQDDDDTYIYTDEFAGYGTGARAVLNDAAGADTINTAAVTSSVSVNLNAGSTSTIAGSSLTIGAGTSIENATSGDGNDTLTGNSQANILRGGRGQDVLNGADANDILDGGAGDDILTGGSGDDTLTGGLGADTLRGGAGSDALDGGGGFDVADYQLAAAAVTVNLATGIHGGEAAGDSYISIERILGSDGFGDTLIGGAGDSQLYGNGGSDWLQGGAGNDTLRGGRGNDLFVIGQNEGDDVIDDFQAGPGLIDRIDLSARSDVASLSGLLAIASDNSVDTTLSFGNSDSLLLRGVRKADLRDDDFIFRANVPPVVTASSVTVSHDASVSVSTLLSFSDGDGDTAASYSFWDSGTGPSSGYFAVNGVRQGSLQSISVAAADLNSVTLVGGSGPGTDQLWVRASDGLSTTDWLPFVMTTTNQAPDLTASDVSLNGGSGVSLASLLGYSDGDGDAAVRYQFRDQDSGPNSAYIAVGGVQRSAGATHEVLAGDLGGVTVVGGLQPGINTDTLRVRASDGAEWSAWQSLTVTSDGPEAPALTASDVTLLHDASVSVSTLLSFSDGDGDAAASYSFWDSGADPSSGYFAVNGVRQGAVQSISVAAADLNSVTLVGGSGPGTDQLWVRGSDGVFLTDWIPFVMTTTNQAPALAASDVTLLHDASVSVSTLLSFSDGDGDAAASYSFWDSGADPSSGDFAVNGVRQGSLQSISVAAADLNSVSLVGGSGPGTDQLWVRGSDGLSLTDWIPFVMTTVAAGVALSGSSGGENVLIGSDGDDLFVFADGSGADTVQDFIVGAQSDDVLDVAAFGFADLTALLAVTSQQGSDAVIALDSDDQVTLIGVDKSNLHADDFLFA